MQPEQLLNGRYRLMEVIGAGGMSVVWRAHDEVLGRTVAVKVLAPPREADPDGLLRGDMLAEARSAAMLSHPNLTNVFDYGETLDADGQPLPFVVMELLSGPTLASRLADGPLPPQEGLRICAQLAAAVAAAHAQGVVHRDIKPGNVILTHAGPKILDFGIAALAGAPDPDPSDHILGTPAYLAPERLTREDVTPAADVFALGVLIYRVLTAELPWTTETAAQALRAHLTDEPHPLPPRDGLPPEVDEVYRRCLARDPARRPTAAEVAAVLAGAVLVRPAGLDGTPEVATLALSAVGPFRWRRHALPAVGGVAATATVLALLFSTLSGGRGDPLGGAAAGPGIAPATTGPATSARPPETSVSPAPSSVTPKRNESPPTRTQPTTPRLTTEAITARGGTIHVLCQGENATLLGIEPAPGYVVHDQAGGPAREVKVVLRSSVNQSEIKAKCGPSGVIPAIKETAR